MLSGTAFLLQTLCLLLTQSRLGVFSLCLSLMAFAVLVVWSGSLKGHIRRRGMAVAALILVLLIAGGRPLLKRLTGAGEEAHSGKFRVYTWRDTLRMAQANPLLGAGIGSFETTYPRYARLQYTAHAHNSYLQIAGETGFPGLIFLVIGTGAILASGMKSLGRWRRMATPAAAQDQSGRQDADQDTADDRESEPASEHTSAGKERPIPQARRSRRRSRTSPDTQRQHQEASGVRSSGVRKDSKPLTPNVQHPAILAGLLAALAGSALHNLFDSDLYIPATALLLGAIGGLTLALSTSPPLETPNARRISPLLLPPPAARLFTSAAALLMTAYALLVAGGRWEANAAEAAVREGSGAAALQRYESAIALDPWNVEYRLSRASLYEASGQAERAAAEYQDALKVASIGKVCYRFGKFYVRQGKKEEAVRMFERARALEPHNMQNLLALADAYKAAGRPAGAEAVYQKMIALYRSPFGAVRALTELVDWEFGVAYLGLAEGALARGEKAQAVVHLREGAGILGEFWRQRNLQAAAIRVRPDMRRSTALRYDWALEQWEKTLRELNRPNEAAEVQSRRAAFRTEMEKEFNTSPSGAS
jgi:tetratricopeptide (TPR) repeat protein